VIRPGAALAVALLFGGCASADVGSQRGGALRGILGPSVQLRAEGGGVRRAGSGVVVAADRSTGRSWIITTRHLFEPAPLSQLWVVTTDGGRRLRARIGARSRDADLAIVEVTDRALPVASLQETARLGDEVRVVAFPWGRQLTVVSGIVSQIATEEGSEVAVEGAVRMVDASVSYGASGGGVFDAESGMLVGIVESYRTARLALPGSPERVLDLPVPGETTVVGASAIRRFLESAGVPSSR
jgi:S1-C subfamily serine protease